MPSTLNDSEYTIAVQNLVAKIQQSSTQHNSLFELASLYFTTSDSNVRVLRSCQENLTVAEEMAGVYCLGLPGAE